MSAKIERIERVLVGERPDRVPYSVWTHFPGVDLDPERLAETTAAFYREFDLDFIKNMSNGMFSIEDWGCECDYSEIASGGVAKVKQLAIAEPASWERLEDLDVGRGALGRELRSLGLLLRAVGGEAPVLATVFSPLTTAKKLSGPALAEHIETHPDAVRRGLATIAASTARFAARAVEMGCSGVYFASQMSQLGEMTEARYAEFGLPYDLQVLEAVKGAGWFNVMHIHGDRIMFELLKGYPVQGISWHVWETAPSVEEFAAAADACIVGGLRRFKITAGELPEIARDVAEMLRLTGGRKLFLAPGCVIRAPFDRATLRFLTEAVRGTGKAGPR